MFESIKKSMREMFKSTEKMLDDAEADFKEFDDAKIEPNTETKTVEEIRHPDGGVTIRTTTIRKLVVRK
jgi:hypothetical protein